MHSPSRPALAPTVPSDDPLGPVTDVPGDWHPLWQQMLAVRSGAPDVPPTGTTRALLQWRPAEGWLPAGPLSARSAALFDLYKPLLDARQGAHDTWTVAQMGQSLDGFVATSTGDSYYVNGAHSLVHLHRLRALSDAIVVGAGTVAIDNPQLTTRRVAGPDPVRVVIDPGARLDGRARVFTDRQAPTLWLCDARHADTARRCLDAASREPTPPAEVLGVPGLLGPAGTGCCARRATAALAARGLRLLFVEGGGVTVSRFFAAGVLQRLHLSVAPVLVGQGRRGLQVPAQPVMADCPRPPARMVVLGDDMLWDLDLQDLPGPARTR